MRQVAETVEAIRQHTLIDVLAFGRFDPGHLHITWTDRPRPTAPEIEAAIDRTWPEQLDRAKREGRRLFNGTMARYIQHRQEANDLHLLTGPTCYRDFVGTNLFNPNLIEHADWSCFSNPVGTTATILTADGSLLYGRRNHTVAFHAGYVHTFGGALEPADGGHPGHLDGFGSILRELREELALEAGEIDRITCVGLIRDRQIWQPEMLFEVTTSRARAEIVSRLHEACDQEHSAIEHCLDNPAALVAFMNQVSPIAPVALGSMLLHGWDRWGGDWVVQASQHVAHRRHIEKYRAKSGRMPGTGL